MTKKTEKKLSLKKLNIVKLSPLHPIKGGVKTNPETHHINCNIGTTEPSKEC